MKLYLAGPDVFRPDAREWAAQARETCRRHGFDALTPLDHAESEPGAICEANLALLRKAQIIVANLNPFRGAEPDSGTCFELGFGLALGKKLYGYMDGDETLLQRVCRIESLAIDAPSRDRRGLLIEDFGLPANLMLAMSAHIVRGGLEECLQAIRPRHGS